MKRRHLNVSLLLLALLGAICCLGRASYALDSDQLALVVNSKVPEGRKLAEFYAAQRHIPDNRIVELSFPTTSDDLNPTDYDSQIAPAIRDFLKKNELEYKVSCLVTFWGVPLRISSRGIDPAAKKELGEIKDEAEDVRAHVEQQVKAAETLAHSLNGDFKPANGVEIESLGHRAEQALTSALASIQKMEASAQRDEAFNKMMDLARDLAGKVAMADKLARPEVAKLAPRQSTTQEIVAARTHLEDVARQIRELQSQQPQNSDTRARLREIFKTELGQLSFGRLLQMQIRELDNKESESAFDSELALLWWPPYPKSRWTINPLDWHIAGHPEIQLPRHTLMVMRLDGPSERYVHELIETSIKIESQGLSGEIVLDARGKPPTEPYGQYDQTIRNLGKLLAEKTKLKVVMDDKEALIPKDSEHDIAIYCGWYSLRNYVSPGTFVPGAVGYHVASGEMVSLHNKDERGWCKNLMDAGVVATLGPVAEPYLQSFPPADEFFPLLMTGKLSLAEVYWRTTPWTSWMQCCVGDPLYCPFKTNPPLKPDDLPEGLRKALTD